METVRQVAESFLLIQHTTLVICVRDLDVGLIAVLLLEVRDGSVGDSFTSTLASVFIVDIAAHLHRVLHVASIERYCVFYSNILPTI